MVFLADLSKTPIHLRSSEYKTLSSPASIKRITFVTIDHPWRFWKCDKLNKSLFLIRHLRSGLWPESRGKITNHRRREALKWSLLGNSNHRGFQHFSFSLEKSIFFNSALLWCLLLTTALKVCGGRMISPHSDDVAASLSGGATMAFTVVFVFSLAIDSH